MADALTALNGFLGGFQVGFGNPIGMAINMILSTIIGGVVILVVVELFAKHYAEQVSPLNAFLLALIATVINQFGIVAVLSGLMATLPFAGILIMILPILVWFGLAKFFFREMTTVHVLMISVICYILSIYVIPMLVGMAFGFIPSF